MCNEGAHTVVYDFERAESVCSRCGCVIDEMKPESLIEFNVVPKSRPLSHRIGWASKNPSNSLSLERSIRDMFLQKSTAKIVQDKALELGHTVRRRGMHKGYHNMILSSALVYMAHRLSGVPVALSECTASARERKRVACCYNRLCEKLELTVPGFGSADYLSHLAKKMKIGDDTSILASKILERVKEKRLVRGANPIGVAAATLYIAAGLTDNRVTQKELASVARVSEVTVRANCKILEGLLQNLGFSERRA